MKVCIIGNSHIAALKLALRDGLFADDALEFVFWGVRGKQFLDVRLENGRLVSPDREFVLRVSGGKYETIDPGGFEALVFHGPMLNYTRFLALTHGLRSDPRSFSSAFLSEGIGSQLDRNPACALIGQIRKGYEGRILISPQPLISEQSGFFREGTIGSGERVALDEILQQYFLRLGAEYLPQPERTVVDHKYTAASYSVGSVALLGDLDIVHPSDEHDHMNGLYGAEVLRAIATALSRRA